MELSTDGMNFHFVMSLLAMSLEYRFRMNRKGGPGGRWVGSPSGWKRHGCTVSAWLYWL